MLYFVNVFCFYFLFLFLFVLLCFCFCFFPFTKLISFSWICVYTTQPAVWTVNNSRVEDSLIGIKVHAPLCTGTFYPQCCGDPRASWDLTIEIPKIILFWHCFEKCHLKNIHVTFECIFSDWQRNIMVFDWIFECFYHLDFSMYLASKSIPCTHQSLILGLLVLYFFWVIVWAIKDNFAIHQQNGDVIQ